MFNMFIGYSNWDEKDEKSPYLVLNHGPQCATGTLLCILAVLWTLYVSSIGYVYIYIYIYGYICVCVYNIWEYIYIYIYIHNIYIYIHIIYIYISNFKYRLKIGDGEPYRMMSPCWKGRHRNSRNSLQPGQPSGSRERHRLIPSNPKKETFRYIPYIYIIIYTYITYIIYYI